MVRRKRTIEQTDPQNTTQKNKDRATWTPLQTMGELKCSEKVNWSAPKGWAVPTPVVAPFVLLLLQIRWWFMKKETTLLRLRQTKYIRGDLWHGFTIIIYIPGSVYKFVCLCYSLGLGYHYSTCLSRIAIY
jgi:hypothetical protein